MQVSSPEQLILKQTKIKCGLYTLAKLYEIFIKKINGSLWPSHRNFA